MGTAASSLPYSIDQQVGAPHDHNGWALHNGKSTDANNPVEVSVFVGKKPALAKTPCSQRYPGQMQLVPALHHYNYCRKLRHPQILTVYATLDTDNPSAATSEGGGTPSKSASSAAASSSNATTGDLIIVTEPCVSLTQWLLSNPTNEQLAWGLQCVVEGLHFMHNSAQLAHGNISPSSLYVTPSGDVKLWNFNLVTPVGPNGVGPTPHFQEWEQACTPETYRSPERVQKQYTAMSQNGGVHVMDSYSVGVLIDHWYQGRIPAPLQKAVQRMQTPNLKMRPRLQPLLKCPVFDTPYQKMQLQLQEIQIQPVEQKVALWQQLGLDLQSPQNKIPKDVALHKILPLVISSCQIITNNESMLAQDMYRREGRCFRRILWQRFVLISWLLVCDAVKPCPKEIPSG
jgi:SCY1-like protein 1